MGLAQGDSNLLLQYNRGPDLDAFYRKWNFDLHTHLVYGNMREDYTFRKISFSAGIYIQYKFSKTLALNSGVDYFNLSYQYNLAENQSFDQLLFELEKNQNEKWMLFGFVLTPFLFYGEYTSQTTYFECKTVKHVSSL